MNDELRMTNGEWKDGRTGGAQGPFASLNPAFDNRKSTIDIPRAFTLVELVVVLALMSTALGLVVLRLDGFSDRSRLRSAAGQLAAWVRLAQTEAKVSGAPRLIEYDPDNGRVTLHKPRAQKGVWAWDDGVKYDTGTAVRIDKVVGEGQLALQDQRGAYDVHVGPDGRFPTHALVLALHDRYAVIVLRSFEEIRVVFASHPPQAREFDILMLELARDENEKTR
jgi:type II secretion system protein H